MLRHRQGGAEAMAGQQALQLAWGRNLARMGQDVEAERVLLAVADSRAPDPASTAVRWQARTRLAALHCAQTPLRSREALLRLQGEARVQWPQGGTTLRDIDQALQACASATLATTR